MKKKILIPQFCLLNIKDLHFFLISKEGKEFIKSYKRMESIINEKEFEIKIDQKLFQKIEEERLYSIHFQLNENYKKTLKF